MQVTNKIMTEKIMTRRLPFFSLSKNMEAMKSQHVVFKMMKGKVENTMDLSYTEINIFIKMKEKLSLSGANNI